MLSARRYTLTRVRLLHFLEDLKADSVNAGSICVPLGSSEINIGSNFKKVFDIKTIPEDLPRSIAQSPTGGMVFWGSNHWYLVMPPFPVDKEGVSNTCEIEPLYSLLHKEFLLGLVLVRSGQYGVGVFQGERLLSSKLGTGLVHARHRQGGSSSQRFERHREKQLETFFTRVCAHAREQLEPYARRLDYLVYGGNRETILDFRKQCHFLHQFDSRTVGLILNTREPKQSGMADAIQEVWSSRVIQW